MKVAVICRPFSFHGGVETSTAGLLNALVERGGYDVDLITSAGQFPVPGVRIRRLAVPGQPSVLRQLCFALAAKRAAQAGGYDVVQSHERCLAQDIYRAGEGCHRGISRCDGADRTSSKSSASAPLVAGAANLHPAVRAPHRRDLRRGKSEIERLYRTPASSVTVVYNGVDLSPLPSGQPQALAA